jgi:hypothetical protein
MKASKKFENIPKRKWTEHMWLGSNQLVGCTFEGELYFIEKEEVKETRENAFMSEEANSYVVAL